MSFSDVKTGRTGMLLLCFNVVEFADQLGCGGKLVAQTNDGSGFEVMSGEMRGLQARVKGG